MTVITRVLVVAGIVVPGLDPQCGRADARRPGRRSRRGARPDAARDRRAARVKVRLTDVRERGAARTRRPATASLDVALVGGAPARTAEVRQSLSATDAGRCSRGVDAAHLRDALASAGVPPATIGPALDAGAARDAVIAPPPSDQAARDGRGARRRHPAVHSLAMYGGAVATGVAQEKTSRTAEVLLAAVRPDAAAGRQGDRHRLCGLGQLAIAAVAGLIANAVVHSAKIPRRLGPAARVPAVVPARLRAVRVRLRRRGRARRAPGGGPVRDDAVAMPLLAGYLLVYAAIARRTRPGCASPRSCRRSPRPDAGADRARPRRLVGVPLDGALMLAAIYVTVRLASRIYSGALVRSGARLSWRAALRGRPQ